MSNADLLWTPTPERIAATEITRFADLASQRSGEHLPDYPSLHAWSVEDRASFWNLVWDEFGVIGDKGDVVLSEDTILSSHFFPQATLNFAQNLLRRRGASEAMVFYGEDKVTRRFTWDELHGLVSKLQQLFKSIGVKKGDRIAAMMPNMGETAAAMLTAASLGAVWCSCSPDFGLQGVLDRFGQIEPVILIVPDGYWYNGKLINVGDKVAQIADALPSVQKVLVVDYVGDADQVAAKTRDGIAWSAAISAFLPKPVAFEQVSFSHPLYILFSSGTTGIPKCIVHGTGGTLLQHLKEHRLHSDIRPGDRVFYFTTCGWMMWNWLVSALATEATLILFDGSPFKNGCRTLFDLIDTEKVTFFGTSAKFIDTVRKSGDPTPMTSHSLSSLKTIASTGSPLSPESFRFVYQGIKEDVHLASISGGTDIVSCFVLGVPTLPVYVGEIQAAGLGLAVEVWNDDGQPVASGKGELVCTKAFPSMPIGFWRDPDGARYKAAYFDRYAEIWCHGDLAEWTEHGGLVIHGRSDATLNPGGVRIGTAEIYNIVEQIPEVAEAICVGQTWDDDVRVILFVRLADGYELTDDLQKTIKSNVRVGASPRHVPAKIVAVQDIPRTKSGKIVELAVRDVIHGRPVRNVEALANPQALAQFERLAELSN